AGMHQPRAIAVEDGQRRVENIAHHLLEVVRSLDRAVHPIHTLDEPSTVVVRPHALGDVDHHAAQSDWAVTILHTVTKSRSHTTLPSAAIMRYSQSPSGFSALAVSRNRNTDSRSSGWR